MNIAEILKAINGRLILMACIGFVSTMGPGLLTLHRFQPEYVKSFDLGKLIAIALAISLPPVLLNSFLLWSKVDNAEEFDINKNIIFAALVTSLEFYAALLSTKIFNLAFNQLVIVLCLIIIGMTFVINRKRKKKIQSSVSQDESAKEGVKKIG